MGHTGSSELNEEGQAGYRQFYSMDPAEISKQLAEKVRGLEKNTRVAQLFEKRGLRISFVKWEDTGRDKNSCMGRNITDVTLCVGDTRFPIISRPNFTDETCDMPIERFSVHVGNENPRVTQLTAISLREYLVKASQYVGCRVKGKGSLWLPRDDKLLVSSQCCILPLSSGRVEFSVSASNYQSSSYSPRVLLLVVSPHGTSAQLTTRWGQLVHFNIGGQKANYLAERLVEKRAREKRPIQGPMTQKEREESVLFVIQVPLLERPKPVQPSHRRNGTRSAGIGTSFESKGPSHTQSSKSAKAASDTLYDDYDDDDDDDYRSVPEKSKGIDHAQLSIGKPLGPWHDDSKFEIERDPTLPIRCTIQHYCVTDTDDISEAVVEEICAGIMKQYNEAHPDERGSLVVDEPSPTKFPRITEQDLPSRPVSDRNFFDF